MVTCQALPLNAPGPHEAGPVALSPLSLYRGPTEQCTSEYPDRPQTGAV